MQINKHHGTLNRTRRRGSIVYLIIHYTAGTGSARNNCKYFAGGNRGASADYFVDDSGIWEYNDPSDGYYTWAVGDGRGKRGITNANSIHIEVVNTGGDFSAAEIGYLKELVPYLMKKYGIPPANVRRHYDASGKLCPKGYITDSRWGWLHNEITKMEVKLGWIKDQTGWWWKEADGSWPKDEWRQIDGKWYWFKGDGYAAQNQWLEIENEWYYFKDSCQACQSECIGINGHWYAFDGSCHMLTGSLTIDKGGAISFNS